MLELIMSRASWDSLTYWSSDFIQIQAYQTALQSVCVCVCVCEYTISISEIICFPHYICRCFNIWAQLCCYSRAERFLFDSHSLGILGNHKPPEQPQMGQKNVPTARRLVHSDTLSFSSLRVFSLLVYLLFLAELIACVCVWRALSFTPATN